MKRSQVTVKQEITTNILTSSQSDYVTINQQILDAVGALIVDNFDNLALKLQRKHGIQAKVSRSAYNFVHPCRQKIFAKRHSAAIMSATLLKTVFMAGISTSSRTCHPSAYFLVHSDLLLVVDIQNCVKAQQSCTYACKVAIYNLQQKVRSLAYFQNHSIVMTENSKSPAQKRKNYTTQRELKEVYE